MKSQVVEDVIALMQEKIEPRDEIRCGEKEHVLHSPPIFLIIKRRTDGWMTVSTWMSRESFEATVVAFLVAHPAASEKASAAAPRRHPFNHPFQLGLSLSLSLSLSRSLAPPSNAARAPRTSPASHSSISLSRKPISWYLNYACWRKSPPVPPRPSPTLAPQLFALRYPSRATRFVSTRYTRTSLAPYTDASNIASFYLARVYRSRWSEANLERESRRSDRDRESGGRKVLARNRSSRRTRNRESDGNEEETKTLIWKRHSLI